MLFATARQSKAKPVLLRPPSVKFALGRLREENGTGDQWLLSDRLKPSTQCTGEARAACGELKADNRTERGSGAGSSLERIEAAPFQRRRHLLRALGAELPSIYFGLQTRVHILV